MISDWHECCKGGEARSVQECLVGVRRTMILEKRQSRRTSQRRGDWSKDLNDQKSTAVEAQDQEHSRSREQHIQSPGTSLQSLKNQKKASYVGELGDVGGCTNHSL